MLVGISEILVAIPGNLLPMHLYISASHNFPVLISTKDLPVATTKL